MKIYKSLSFFVDVRAMAFDIDGVVADTMGSFIRIARDEFGFSGFSKDDITSYWLEACLPMPEDVIDAVIGRILDDPFGTGLEPNSGAVDILGRIAKTTPLLFVTARPSDNVIREWLKTVLIDVPYNRIEVVATGSHDAKEAVLNERGVRFFVEDNLETCQQLTEAGICGIVYDQPWNRHGEACMRVGSWEELASFLKPCSVFLDSF